MNAHGRKVEDPAPDYKLHLIINRKGVATLEEDQFITDADLQLAVIEHSLKQIPMRIILRVLHVELIGSSNPGLHYLPERDKVRTAAEN
jgi:hypothetical protein